jgi:hypothetical protein
MIGTAMKALILRYQDGILLTAILFMELAPKNFASTSLVPRQR